MLGSNTGFRHYVLAHEITSLGYQRLTSITEKSGDNTKSYNQTVFTYGNTAEAVTYLPPVVADLSVQNIRLSNAATVSGDFNGDGSMDFLLYPTTGPNAKRKYWLFDQLNNQYINLGWEHNVGAFEEIFPVSWLTWNEKLLPQQGWCVVKQNTTTNVTSFQGYSTGFVSPIYAQGLKEYVFPKHVVSYYDPNKCNNCLLCPDPIGPWQANNQDKTATPDALGTHHNGQGFEVYFELNVPKRHISGDFNGDGLTDVAVINKSVSYNETYNCQNSYQTYPGGKTYFVNLDRRLASNFVNEAGFLSVRDDSKILVADYNGDGKEDIYVFDTGYVKIYTLTEDKQFVNIYYSPYDTDIVTTKPIILGDYNGDGKMDFMIPKGYNNYAKYTATGTAFIKDWVFDLAYRENSANHTYHVIANDFNNDGKTDIAFVHTYKFHNNTEDGSITVQLYKNNGSAFIAQPFAGSGGQNDISIYPIPIFLNSNQPNQSLELAFISDRKIHRFKSQKDFGKEKLLQSITTGNGVSENITYTPLTVTNGYDDEVYTPRGGNEAYPNIDITSAPTFKVVSRIVKRSSGSVAQQLFKYAGAVTNVSGLGFLGFQNIMRTNWHNNDLPVLSTISKYDITRRGAVTENYTVVGLSYPAIDPLTPFISKSILTYQQELSPTKVFKIKNTAAVNLDGVNNTATETATQYDAYNNPTVNTTLTKSGSTVEQTETVTVDYLNQPAGGTYYYIGRPQRKQVSITSNGDTRTSEEIYTFNSNHLLSQVRKKGHLIDYLTEDNIFDALGNITQKTITAPGLAPRVTRYEYDPSRRFLIKSTDIEGLETRMVYNTANGWLLSTTNPNNLTTQYGYDVWGKKIRTTDYLGKTVTTAYTRTASVQTRVTTQSEEGSESILQLDDLGREMISGTKNIDGTWSYTMTRYDAYGRKVSVGEPVGSITASPTQATTYRYDIYGRLRELVAPTGQTTTTAYSGLTTTVNDGTKTVITVKDAIGNIKSLTDPSGTINYTYYAGGNLRQSNYEGNIISMEYDGWGRKTRLTDPSAGTYTYQYNALGELTRETTPKGNTTYVIDNFGKVTEKTILGTGGDTTNSRTTYTYHPTSKLLTNTRFDDFTNGFYALYTYQYDNYNRLSEAMRVALMHFTRQLLFLMLLAGHKSNCIPP